ncbi:MAG TPA: U-box domain-containing protein [Parachlamydiaceae bacterium]|nr:U-box domain-containing protein [Parachlamydiaceae bacterium]
MSMNIPSNSSQKDFVIETKYNKSPDTGDNGCLVLPSMDSFKHTDGMKFTPGTACMTAFSQFGLASGIFAGVYQGALSGISVAALCIGTGIAGACLLEKASVYFNPVKEPELMPSNPAKLREDVIATSLKINEMPNKFRDPISYETIKTPVTFSDDPTSTIYDMETVNSFLKEGVRKNPLSGKHDLDFSKLVYLPEVKKQIEELKAKIIEHNEL